MSEKETLDPTAPALPHEDTKPPDLPWFIPDDEEKSVYRFILAAAKRARQLQAGARPLISTTSRKPTKIAMEEIRAGAVELELNVAPEQDPDDQPVFGEAAVQKGSADEGSPKEESSKS